ncbi:MAG TPA: OsmC family protein [Caldilineaceae bacterium]|nr:OsmC family protein [Caldilineaceae bacterium]
MQNFPHSYRVSASGGREGVVVASAAGLADLVTASPAEFDGPGDQWSPETMLVAAVASCYLLTFRSIARAARFDWNQVRCRVEGILDRVERVTRFTKIYLNVKLEAPSGVDLQKAQQLLQKTEQSCLITRSLNAQVVFETEIEEQ